MADFALKDAGFAESGFDAVLGGSDHGGRQTLAGSKVLERCRVVVPLCANNLASGSFNVSAEDAAVLSAYFAYGGPGNLRVAFEYIKRLCQGADASDLPRPQIVPMDSIFTESGRLYPDAASYFAAEGRRFESCIGLICYRSRWISGDTAVEECIKRTLEAKGIGVIMAFCSGAAEEETGAMSFDDAVLKFFTEGGRTEIELLINFMFYAKKGSEGMDMFESTAEFFRQLDIPVVRPAGLWRKNAEQYAASSNPYASDILSNFIAPELSGVIETVHISTGGGRRTRVPDQKRVDYLARRIEKWVALRKTSNRDKRFAIMLHNAPCAGVEATVGMASDLDAFQSAVDILRRLKAEGYSIENIPKDGAALKDMIMSRKAYSDFRWTSAEDIEQSGGAVYTMKPAEYDRYFQSLEPGARAEMLKAWGAPPGEAMVTENGILVTGISFGNALVMVQPKRGCYGAKCTGEVCKILQDPSCPPSHQYLATYEYLRSIFRADCVVHLGTHGSIEYLPGKSCGLSSECFPDIAIDGLINIYPYNASVISQGIIAKRRSYAALISYLPSPGKGLTKDQQQLASDLAEYFAAVQNDNGQQDAIRERIIARAKASSAVAAALEKEPDFDAAARLMQTQLSSISAARRGSHSRSLGQIPDEDWQQDYLAEADSSGCAKSQEAAIEIKRRLDLAGQEMESLVRAMSGRFISPGPGGDSTLRALDILPTGRNTCQGSQDSVPTRTAYERGCLAAENLIQKYKEDEGRLPRKVALNMTSLDISRCGGEQMSQFLYLMGIRPVWAASGKVEGLEIIPLSQLGRPRIDVTAHISSVLRDSWPVAIGLLDRAVQMASALDEPLDMNFVRADSLENAADGELAESRIFGGQPGTYTSAVGLALKASAWNSEKDLARYFIDASSYVYGDGKYGVHSPDAFAGNIKQLDLSCDITNSRKTDGGASSYSARVQGGFAMAAEALGSKKKLRQYMGESKAGRDIQINSLKDHVSQAVEDTLLNEFWLEEEKREGYAGASEIMQRVQNLFDSKCVGVELADSLIDGVARTCLLDPDMQKWFSENNRFALEESQRRLLELNTRGKWNADPDVLKKLKSAYLMAEGDLEEGLSGAGDVQAGSVEIVTDSKVGSWAERLGATDALLKEKGRR